MISKYNNCSALLLIELATSQHGTTARSINQGISSCIRIDNTIQNHHLVSGVDYLVSSGLKDSSIPFFTNEVKKAVYLEDITKIVPIGADKLLITLKINNEIFEAYCSSIEYGILDELYNKPRYWKSFLNLSGPDIAIDHLNKYYEHLTPVYVDSNESSCILSIEPYIDEDLIIKPKFSDWRNPYTAQQEYSYKDISSVAIQINKLNRIISLSDSFTKSSTRSDHDGGWETTEWTFEMECTIKYGSITRLESQLKKWEMKGFPICNGRISFPPVSYRQLEAMLGIKFSFGNSSFTFPA